jgi:hypothetical protein
MPGNCATTGRWGGRVVRSRPNNDSTAIHMADPDAGQIGAERSEEQENGSKRQKPGSQSPGRQRISPSLCERGVLQAQRRSCMHRSQRLRSSRRPKAVGQVTDQLMVVVPPANPQTTVDASTHPCSLLQRPWQTPPTQTTCQPCKAGSSPARALPAAPPRPPASG